jgi:adenylate cyclase
LAYAPAELQQIVTKALQQNPGERFQSASEMLGALKGLRHKLEFEAEREHSPARHPWLRWIRSPIAGALALLAGGLGMALSFYWLRNPTTTSEIPEKSIAVLPFEYLSSDQADAYLADGIQEEILTRLSRVADLKVISHASTERYKGVPRNIRSIAGRLGVAHVLEGSVQKAGDQLRVHLQLIKAQNDSELWANEYDRNLTDIFAVETDIAAKVVDVLQAKLTGAEQRAISSRPTENAEAHQMYLKGVYYFNKSLPPAIEKSRGYFQQAVKLDPNFASAYAGLADSYGFAAANGLIAPAEGWPKAQAALKRALEIDETLAEPLQHSRCY